jgi:hypothetical protein
MVLGGFAYNCDGEWRRCMRVTEWQLTAHGQGR